MSVLPIWKTICVQFRFPAAELRDCTRNQLPLRARNIRVAPYNTRFMRLAKVIRPFKEKRGKAVKRPLRARAPHKTSACLRDHKSKLPALLLQNKEPFFPG